MLLTTDGISSSLNFSLNFLLSVSIFSGTVFFSTVFLGSVVLIENSAQLVLKKFIFTIVEPQKIRNDFIDNALFQKLNLIIRASDFI